jgi:hypothetical protein
LAEVIGAKLEVGLSWVFRMVLSYSRKAYTKWFFVRTLKRSCAVWKTGYEPSVVCGFLVLYRSIFDLVRELLTQETQVAESRLLNKYLKPDLLIID